MEKIEKRVLVSCGVRNRVVTFNSNGAKDSVLLEESIKSVFSDVLCDKNFFLQVKDVEWGGVFVDFLECDNIPDKSVLKVLVEEADYKV